MNTRMNYRYMNGVGEVLYESIVVDGELRLSNIITFLKDGDFIPEQADLPVLNGSDVEIDGPWHKILDVKLTTDESTVNLTASELIQKFKEAHQAGWSEGLFFEEIAKRAAAAANGFFLREPKKLSHLTDFIVRLQSEEHGRENFKHFNLEHGLDKVIELYLEALKLDDDIERIIGLVVNPQSTETEPGDLVTIYRGSMSGQSCKAMRYDLTWCCGQLGVGDTEVMEDPKTKTYVFNSPDSFDLVKSSLKQNQFLL